MIKDNWDANWAVLAAVNRAVVGNLYQAVDWALYGVVDEVLDTDLNLALDRFMHGPAYRAVHEDPPHPALRDFLGEVR